MNDDHSLEKQANGLWCMGRSKESEGNSLTRLADAFEKANPDLSRKYREQSAKAFNKAHEYYKEAHQLYAKIRKEPPRPLSSLNKVLTPKDHTAETNFNGADKE